MNECAITIKYIFPQEDIIKIDKKKMSDRL